MKKKFNFILASATCSEREFDKTHIKDEDKIAQSAGKYFRNLCEGLVYNGQTVKTFTVRPTTKKECGQTVLKSKDEIVNGVHYHYSTDIYIKGIKRVNSIIRSFCWFLNKQNCKKKDIVIIDPLNISLSIGAVLACKLRKITLIADITDVPICYAFGTENKISLSQRISFNLGKSADMFIFLTEQMNKLMNPRCKPYIVMEGFSDIKMKERNISFENKYDKPIIMYTGAIEKIYGIDILVKGFIKANIPNSELHLYGAGSYTDEVIKLSKKYQNIKYMGCRSNSVIVEEQMKATLLVNPRYTNAEYTKYSFPGKNMEYMASGTSVLTTNLPGMPEDHKRYVFLLKDETDEGVSNSLKHIFSIDNKKLYKFGLEAKKFVINEKSNYIQCKKIIEFIYKNNLCNKGAYMKNRD